MKCSTLRIQGRSYFWILNYLVRTFYSQGNPFILIHSAFIGHARFQSWFWNEQLESSQELDRVIKTLKKKKKPLKKTKLFDGVDKIDK